MMMMEPLQSFDEKIEARMGHIRLFRIHVAEAFRRISAPSDWMKQDESHGL